jgi:hypothetical protein
LRNTVKLASLVRNRIQTARRLPIWLCSVKNDMAALLQIVNAVEVEEYRQIGFARPKSHSNHVALANLALLGEKAIVQPGEGALSLHRLEVLEPLFRRNLTPGSRRDRIG